MKQWRCGVAFPYLPPPHQGGLEVDQLWRGQPFTAQAIAHVIPVVAVVGEGWRKTAWVCSGTSLICTLGVAPLWR
jgi:hypothetical protein